MLAEIIYQFFSLLAKGDSTAVAAFVAAMLGLFGTLVGVFSGILYTRKANKKRRTIDLFTAYLNEVYPKEGGAIYVLRLNRKLCVAEIDQTQYVGNWFDMYAALAIERSLTNSLCSRFGLEERLKEFWHEYKHSKVKGQIGGKGTWPNIEALVK